jgi:hypothetical protein
MCINHNLWIYSCSIARFGPWIIEVLLVLPARDAPNAIVNDGILSKQIFDDLAAVDNLDRPVTGGHQFLVSHNSQ